MKNTLFSKLLIILTSVCVLSSCNKKKVLDDLMERDIYNGEITVNGQKCSFFLEMPIFSPLTSVSTTEATKEKIQLAGAA